VEKMKALPRDMMSCFHWRLHGPAGCGWGEQGEGHGEKRMGKRREEELEEDDKRE